MSHICCELHYGSSNREGEELQLGWQRMLEFCCGQNGSIQLQSDICLANVKIIVVWVAVGCRSSKRLTICVHNKKPCCGQQWAGSQGMITQMQWVSDSNPNKTTMTGLFETIRVCGWGEGRVTHTRAHTHGNTRIVHAHRHLHTHTPLCVGVQQWG